MYVAVIHTQVSILRINSRVKYNRTLSSMLYIYDRICFYRMCRIADLLFHDCEKFEKVRTTNAFQCRDNLMD